MTRALDQGTADASLRLRLGLLYGYSDSDRLFAGTEDVTLDQVFRTTLHLASFNASLDHSSGLGVGAVLPYGFIERVDAEKTTNDNGLGDLEMRLRADAVTLLGRAFRGWPHLVVSGGVVAPTGPYISKQLLWVGEGEPPPPPDKYASLGRGVWWALGDVELFGPIGNRFGWYASLWTRTPLGEAENGFDWGAERRVSVAGSWRAIPQRLTASVAGEWQWRDRATELVYDVNQEPPVLKRTDFISGGGDWFDVTPTVRVEWTQALSSSFTLRVPVWRDVRGMQGVQNTSGYVSLQYALDLGPTAEKPNPTLAKSAPVMAKPGDLPNAPEVAAKVVPGRVTLVDYGATWCEPCERLEKELATFEKQRPDLVFVRMDGSEWDDAKLDHYLPGIGGFPVLDIYGKDGRLVSRLVGADVFSFRQFLPN